MRHRARHHGERAATIEDSLSDTTESDVPFTTPPSRRMKAVKTAPTSNVTTDTLRDAVLCMLRRTSDINLPALSKYLGSHFSAIPEEIHVAVIVSAFTAAQKVAATYVEAMLDGDNDRTLHAKKAMSRWLHGLSAVEPRRPSKFTANKESGVSSLTSSEDLYSPSSNFLLKRQMPVPYSSAYHRRQLENKFNRLNTDTDVTSDTRNQLAGKVVNLETVVIGQTTPTSDDGAENQSTTVIVKPVNIHQTLNDVVTTGANDAQAMASNGSVTTPSTIEQTTPMSDEGADNQSTTVIVEPTNVHQTLNNVMTAGADDAQAMASDGSVTTPSTVKPTTQEVISFEEPRPESATKMEEEMSDVEPDDHPRREAIVDAAVQAVANEMTDMDGICTFDELFAAMNADLIKPLPAQITPIQSPIYINDEEELLQLHPSPVASLEESSMAADKDIISTPAHTQSKRELSQEKNVPLKKKVASSISVKNDNDKENVKRHSTEDYSISHKKIRDRGDRDWGNFKIPHKPVQGQSSSHSSREHSKPLWDNDRSTSRHPSSSHRSTDHRRPLNRLTEEERRWLSKMPSNCRRR